MTKFEEEVKRPTATGLIPITYRENVLKELSKAVNKNYTENAKILREHKEYIAFLENKLDINNQLQQQALPVVPECVAEWYESHGESSESLEFYIYLFCGKFYSSRDSRKNRELTNFEKWFGEDKNKPIETLIRMQDGYTVEKPQLFYIELPNVYGLKNKVSVSKVENGTIVEFSNGKNYALKLTEQEIKSIDERYWQFAVPVEDGE